MSSPRHLIYLLLLRYPTFWNPLTPPPHKQATPPYRLLLAEQEAAQLRIGSRVREAEDGALGRSLAALRHLVGWSSASRRLLISRHGRSHGHLEDVGEKVLSGAETTVLLAAACSLGARRPPGGHTGQQHLH